MNWRTTRKKLVSTSAIILVPEIALTSQLVDEFRHEFKNVLVVHSKQTEAERHHIWTEALDAATPTIVIGPRSALFAPLAPIGLIAIDECHEPSYKQEQSPRYSALLPAVCLVHTTKQNLCSVVPHQTSATITRPTCRTRPIFTLPRPARNNAQKPDVELVDMTKRGAFTKHRFISDNLITQITSTLTEGTQTLIFHNRRGTASTTLCENCGWQAGCPRCFVPLTLHADSHTLMCHICSMSSRVPTSCPECGFADVIHKGIGTKLIESELKKLFPKARIARFDGDTDTNETLEKRYSDVYNGDIDIIVGTQVVAKGLDLPHLRTVGVVQADAGLSLPGLHITRTHFPASQPGRWPRRAERAFYKGNRPELPAHPPSRCRWGIAKLPRVL